MPQWIVTCTCDGGKTEVTKGIFDNPDDADNAATNCERETGCSCTVHE